ncbi:MAG TPA: IS1182 family transposase [Ktedonobacteraceae bacterium]|nr:IS1182 family transposase [Ktedonobacteraceae bacterium]
MSLHPQAICPVPEETVRIAHAAYPKGNLYMQVRDELGTIYEDQNFAHLFPHRGQPAEAPWRLLLVSVLQFAEGLSDRQAADAVRGRLDWKYLLGLELTDPGFDASVLCEFRARLVEGKAEQKVLQPLLEVANKHGWLKERGKQRTDSTHVLGAIRTLNRLETVGETMRATLNILATVVPEWLCSILSPDWFDRYEKRFEAYRLPKGKVERQRYAEQVGADGFCLLQALYSKAAPSWLREIPMVQTLRQVWVQQYYASEGSVQWRVEEDLAPSALLIHSPYDVDARFSTKRDILWAGYKVHLTETCDDETPHLITHVETTPATTYDGAVMETIHAALEEKGLLPEEHMVDSGYLDAEILVSSLDDHAVTLVGPVLVDTSWQAKAEQGFAITNFAIDWEQQQVVCPVGKSSRLWIETHNRHGNNVIHIKFNPTDCLACPSRTLCTKAKSGARMLTLHPHQQHYLALQQARKRQTTASFKETYARRAGIEGTIAQGVHGFDLRRSRYIGLAKTRLQHALIASALNLFRMGAWFMEKPRAQTRVSRFARLATVQQVAA